VHYNDGVPFGLPPITPQAAARIAVSLRHDDLAAREERGDWYSAYLESDLWARTRTLALEYHGDACCLCNAKRRVNVHHRTYDRIGKERLADLIVLCRDCHAIYHGKAA
jgi:hypothetical protein